MLLQRRQSRLLHALLLTAAGASVAAAQEASPRTVELDLIAAPAQLTLRPGTTTPVYAYNGSVPGPTLELREGDRVIIHFRNDLPEPTTVHWHGLHLPFAADGSPFHPVGPGETYDYEFTVRPGSAGTYWYHPHPHHSTGWQVTKGLYGAVVAATDLCARRTHASRRIDRARCRRHQDLRSLRTGRRYRREHGDRSS